MFDFAFNAQRFAVYLIPTLLGIIMHEVAHGWMASRKGDQTARFMGRLTLNPVSHFDALGAAVFLLTSLGTGFIFGWAKPVPVNVRNLRDPARDMMWVALAGPVTNFLLAIGFALALGAVVAMLPSPDISDTTRYFLLMLVAGVNINLCLAWINLLPIPPLDGSKVLMMLLPYRQSAWLERNQRYLSLALWILILVGVLSTPLSYLSNWIMHFFVWATQWIGTLVQMVM